MKKRTFKLIVFLSPEFWWLVFKLPSILSEWISIPNYFFSRLQNIFTEERLVNIGIMRWANLDSGILKILSKFMYNRAMILVDEFFGYLSYFSPRFYFQSGDGSKFSPPGIEPIPLILFPLFVLGIVESVRKKSLKIFLLLILFALIPFILGTRSFAFLWPMAALYIYISSVGVSTLKESYRKTLLIILFTYGVFLGGKLIWTVF